jgi:hypothetical protein
MVQLLLLMIKHDFTRKLRTGVGRDGLLFARVIVLSGEISTDFTGNHDGNYIDQR